MTNCQVKTISKQNVDIILEKSNKSIDFLDYKIVIKYLLLFTFLLFAGNYFKDFVGITISFFVLLFVLTGNLYKSIELYLIWLFSYGFYLGQGYLTIEVLSKYVVKPSFLLFIIFSLSFTKIPAELKKTKFIFVWILFLLITILSAIFHKQSVLVIITLSSFYILYLILSARLFTVYQYKKILNIFIATAIMQTIVSFLQISQMISPSTTILDDGSGGKYEWAAGLDDVASGTFGPVSSHIVSWYAAIIALLSILIWTITKKKKYIVVACLTFIQFAMVDSKIIMGVTILMMLYLLYFLNRHRRVFQLNIHRLIFLIIIVCGIGFGLFKGWDHYYKYISDSGGDKSMRGLQNVYEKQILSKKTLFEYLPQWGKIQGFRSVFEDFMESDLLGIIWGYGIQGFSYNEKGNYILNKDTPIMRINNFTNSRYSLIDQFAQSGLIGFTLFFISILFWYKYNIIIEKFDRISMINNCLLKFGTFFTFLAAFLYSISITSIVVIAFAGVIASLKNYSTINKNPNNQKFI